MAAVAPSLTFALPKGRILKQARPLLAQAGVDLAPLFADKSDRRLMFDVADGIRVLLVKPTDVPTYVFHGIADFGIAGRDTLEEAARDLYEPLDLEIGRCRMCVAQPADAPVEMAPGRRVTVATKYPRVAERHYRRRGIQADIIPLYGSVELGPLTALSEQIVDLVESGETLRQNQLVEVETIFEVSSRLVVHPASLKLKPKRVSAVLDGLRVALEQRRESAA